MVLNQTNLSKQNYFYIQNSDVLFRRHLSLLRPFSQMAREAQQPSATIASVIVEVDVVVG